MNDTIDFWAEVEHTVQFFDLDPMEIVWHGNYIKYIETARCALLDKINYNYPAMRASGYAWPIVDMRMKYVRPAVFGQKLIIRAQIVEWESRLKIEYEIRDARSQECLNKSYTIQVAVDINNGEMCYESPKILFEKLGIQDD